MFIFTIALLMADTPNVPDPDQMLRRVVVDIARKQDSFSAFRTLESSGTVLETAKHYSALIRDIYNHEHDVPLMVLFGRRGIEFTLSHAESTRESDPKLAEELKSHAKTMSYNLGANSWPGWNDEGIIITATDLAVGMDAARLNLRLAGELQRDAGVFGHAHWLMGAHLLASKQFASAEEQFAASAKKAREAENTEAALMADGYRALTRELNPATASNARGEWDAALQQLEQRDSGDAKFFAQQLRVAREVFERRFSQESP